MGTIVQADLPRIGELLQDAVGVDSYKAVERMGGLTNHTYHVTLDDGREYVVRIPGEGTEEMIAATRRRAPRARAGSASTRRCYSSKTTARR